MRLLQTTLTRTADETILVHGTEEEKNLDCIAAHSVIPTFLKVRLLAENESGFADPAMALAAIREAFANPTLG
jgi:hypothetical protein